MKKILLLTIGWLAFLPMVKAQQPSLYSIYHLNPVAYNCGYAGSTDAVVITGVFRKQWLGLNGSPTTQNLTAHLPIGMIKGGVGLQLENDIIGAQRLTSTKLMYSFKQQLTSKLTMSAGVALGMTQQGLNGSKLRAPDGNYEGGGVDHQDPIIPVGNQTGFLINSDLGIALYSKQFRVGVAAGNLYENRASFSGAMKLKRNFTVDLAYKFKISDNFDLQPSAILRTDMVKYQPEFNFNAFISQNYLVSLGVRGYSSKTLDALVLGAGLNISKNIFLMYSYDMTLSGLKNANSGSHEVLLTYAINTKLGKGQPPKVIYNPRLPN